jgi:hypothetical protein
MGGPSASQCFSMPL